MPRLSTHVLDTANGRPAAGMRVRLYLCEPRRLVMTATTNADGRTDEPLLQGEAFVPGVYELVFSVAGYFALPGGATPFLGEVVVRFGVSSVDSNVETNYHVPLLVSPYGYSTYRGS